MSHAPLAFPVAATVVAQRQRMADRRRAGLRGRASRMGVRFAALLASDLLALVAVRLLLPEVGGTSWLPGNFRLAGPLSSPGDPASLVFWSWLLIGLALTGSYTRYRGLNTPMRLASACLLASLVATLPLGAVVGIRVAMTELGIMALITWLALLTTRRLAETFLARVWHRAAGVAPAVLVGPPSEIISTHAEAVTAPGGDFRIVASYELPASALSDAHALRRAVNELVDQYDAQALVVTEDLTELQLEALINSALDSGCLVLVPPRAVSIEGVRPRLVWHRDQAFLEFATPGLHITALLTKRITDLIGATLLMPFAILLALVIAILVKLDSPGPVFFEQPRAGLGGRRFKMLKFRTMRASAEEEKKDLAHLNHSGDHRLFKIPEDPRVTRFGRFLRRWSLDEVPQLWNVLRGDMSLVGPRPFFESDFEAYEEHHFRRLDTKPGITGLWQVSGRSDVVNFEDVVFLDRQYIEQWSLRLDLSILLRTMPSVIRRKGAY